MIVSNNEHTAGIVSITMATPKFEFLTLTLR